MKFHENFHEKFNEILWNSMKYFICMKFHGLMKFGFDRVSMQPPNYPSSIQFSSAVFTTTAVGQSATAHAWNEQRHLVRSRGRTRGETRGRKDLTGLVTTRVSARQVKSPPSSHLSVYTSTSSAGQKTGCIDLFGVSTNGKCMWLKKKEEIIHTTLYTYWL
jgi:hypothetical protein